MEIKLNNLVPNNYNPREIFRGAAMEELKNSMDDIGLIHPILVRQTKNGKFEVVAGMRRYYAAKDLKWEVIECYKKKLTDLEAIKVAFSENIKREDLNPIELGKMYQTYMGYLPLNKTKNGKNLTKNKKELWTLIAEEFKLSNTTIRSYISLLDLPNELRSLITKKEKPRLPKSYGFEIARLPKEQMMTFYEKYYKNKKTRIHLEDFKKQISKQLKGNELKGKEKREKLELLLKRIDLELNKLIQSRDAFIVKINSILQLLNKKYTQKFEYELAIEFLEGKIGEYNSQKRVDIIAKELKDFEHKVDDLDVLLDRTNKEHISICPYCLAKIDTPIIKKKKDIAIEKIDNLNNELHEINSTIEFIRETYNDLLEYEDRLNNKSEVIEIKILEKEEIENEISRL